MLSSWAQLVPLCVRSDAVKSTRHRTRVDTTLLASCLNVNLARVIETCPSTIAEQETQRPLSKVPQAPTRLQKPPPSPSLHLT
jgi:hypothetical protein